MGILSQMLNTTAYSREYTVFSQYYMLFLSVSLLFRFSKTHLAVTPSSKSQLPILRLSIKTQISDLTPHYPIANTASGINVFCCNVKTNLFLGKILNSNIAI